MSARRALTSLHSIINDIVIRHEGHHDESNEDEEETEEDIRARLDSWRNHAAASAFWYAILAILLITLTVRLVRSSSPSVALSRRLLSSPIIRWWRLDPWPLSKIAIVLLYALFITSLITIKSIDHDDDYLERLGFRAAWVSVTQPPLTFLLAARVNPIGLVIGTSYEQINWLHRWAARVLLGSVTVHASFFLAEWLPAGFLWTELQDVAIVKWGFGAWFVLIWMAGSSLLPVRRWRYEFFVAQHIGAAVALLALLFLHVPEHHQFSVWCAFAAFVYDVVTRAANPLWRNVRLRLPAAGKLVPRYAFSAEVDVVDEHLTAVTIKNVSFKWTPGQHILIWSPAFPWQTPHPFSIANASDPKADTQDAHLLIKTKRGLTRHLNAWATSERQSLPMLVAGPYGSPSCDWRSCTNLVLVSGSTGGSYTAAVLGGILTSGDAGRLRNITAVFVVRRRGAGWWYVRRLAGALPAAKGLGISVNIKLAVTRGGGETVSEGDVEAGDGGLHKEEEEGLMAGEQEGEPLQEMARRWSTEEEEEEYTALKEEVDAGGAREDSIYPSYDSTSIGAAMIKEVGGRPDIHPIIRREVERATGTVGVAVCAGSGLEGAVRMAVARVSRSAGGERDIWLHAERAGG